MTGEPLSPLRPAGPSGSGPLPLTPPTVPAPPREPAADGGDPASPHPPDDLDRAVALLREAVDASAYGDPQRPARLSLLSAALRKRYQARRDLGDLGEAVERIHEVLRIAPGNGRDLVGDRLALGDLLELRARRTGNSADAEEAVASCGKALEDCPVDRPERGDVLDALGRALMTRYDCTGRLSDLHDAVERLAAAIRHQPGSGATYARHLATLAEALMLRYSSTEEWDDLLAAVGLYYTAFETTPEEHSARRSHAADLGDALRVYYDRTKQESYLMTAVELLEYAVSTAGAPPSHHLSALGIAWHRRYDAQQAPADLDRAVEAHKAAALSTDEDSVNRDTMLMNLAIALHARASARPDALTTTTDLGLAIDCLRAALAHLPAHRPARGAAASSLAGALSDRFVRTADAEDRQQAIIWGTAAREEESADADVRISAALATADLIAEEDPDRAADLAESALRLFPQLAARYAFRNDQLYMVSRLGGVAGRAAARVLSAHRGTPDERAARAFQVLESGRAVLLGHALGTRGDLADLTRTDPELVRRFKEARRLVEDPEPDGFPAVGISPIVAEAAQLERTAREQRQQAAEFARLTDEIRDRIAAFGAPPSLAEARADMSGGAFVALNVTSLRSDALLLTGEGITSLELPALNIAEVMHQVTAFRKAVDVMARDGDLDELLAAQDVLVSVLAWLWDAVAEPVLNRLGHTGQPQPEGRPWPRLWWAPGGLLSALPLHAAGYHHTDPASALGCRTVMDRVVSSYTPTLRALRHARQQARRQRGEPPPHRALLVAMPLTPGLPDGGPLDHASDEVARLGRHFAEATVLCNPDVPMYPPADGPALRSEVLARLPGTAVAHFSCHGVTDGSDPLSSRLLLHDHGMAPLTVRDLLPVDLDSARLAYLSACRTASSTVPGRLSDEAIHLTSAFQLAGFPHVIGSLWEIDDAIAATIADIFYERLHTDSGALRTDRAAEALHSAVRAVRDGADLPGPYDRTRNPYLWAAYLHAGA